LSCVGELKCASLARTVDTLKGRGDLTQAVAAARQQLCEESIKRMQSDSTAALHQQLAAEERTRRGNALKQVADLQVRPLLEYTMNLRIRVTATAAKVHYNFDVLKDVLSFALMDKQYIRCSHNIMHHYEN
jgi:hypothetical protein